MPAGVPVATVAANAAGPKNAALLAARILALGDARVAAALERFAASQAKGVLEKDARVSQQYGAGPSP
jgi:phosphoribosylcarboxyaminoimidazole (NCAIR) mutase